MADEKKIIDFEVPEGEKITADTIDELTNGKGEE